jgi:DNA-binding MarR family transcriptional regulator
MASDPPRLEVRPPPGVRFLLVQLGFHSARGLATRLAPLGLEPRHYGVLRTVAALEGQTQQAVGSRLRLAPPRMVALIDDLEARELVERRRNPSDRRAYGLFLTRRGRDRLNQALDAAESEQDALLACLDHDQRDELERLLVRVAEQQGLTEVLLPATPPADAFDL